MLWWGDLVYSLRLTVNSEIKEMKIVCVVFIVLLAATVLIAQDWQELKSDHFIVYFAQDKAFADDVLRKAEEDYDRIASDLGYARYSNFWTWSNRVRIYIYPDHASYVKDSGEAEWSEGMADYEKKEIHTYSGSQG